MEPLDLTAAADVRLWMDCDICSMVEGAWGVPVRPAGLSTPERVRWLEALQDAWTPARAHADDYNGPRFWVLRDGQRAGTIQVGSRAGNKALFLHSLYTFPEHRRCGLASRLLEELTRVSTACDAGLQLGTFWVWQPSVRFYLARGLWVFAWKRDISFFRFPGMPGWELREAGREAWFGVRDDGTFAALYHARADGDRLLLEETEVQKERRESGPFAFETWHAEPTFALALAVRGWPLIRSDKEWSRRRTSCDCGAPEGLAYKIEIFEAMAREHGWRVDTPRIPGLRYRDYDDID